MNSGSPDILERLTHRFPSLLVDAVAEHEPGKRLVAFKNVTPEVGRERLGLYRTGRIAPYAESECTGHA